MSRSFTELDFQQTPLGELILRKRRSPSLDGQEVYEVTLNREFLMSSVVVDSEEALATLALEAWGTQACDVLIGGLGLGCTAAALLRSEYVRRAEIVEWLEPVIDWHRRRLLPVSDALQDDPRVEVVHADFFRFITEAAAQSDRQYDLILLDIDHSPDSWLHESHASFYTVEGLTALTGALSSEGIFGLWSAEPPATDFIERLESVFESVQTHPIRYYHPMLHQWETNAIIIAQRTIN